MESECLKGRRALVCGASAGIGRASALALAEMGAQVVALGRRQERLDQLVAELPKATESSAIVCDLNDLDAVAKMADGVLAQGDVHILVNNTGGPPGGPLLQATPEDFSNTLQRHLFAAHLLVQRLVPGMERAGYGRIVNIISTSVREPIAGLGVSNTVRSAVAGWAKTLSSELPPGVTINNVLPGFTDTERLDGLKEAKAAKAGVTPDEIEKRMVAQVPEGRLAHAEEVASAVAYFASPAASFVRGTSLAVDGGRTRSI